MRCSVEWEEAREWEGEWEGEREREREWEGSKRAVLRAASSVIPHDAVDADDEVDVVEEEEEAASAPSAPCSLLPAPAPCGLRCVYLCSASDDATRRNSVDDSRIRTSGGGKAGGREASAMSSDRLSPFGPPKAWRCREAENRKRRVEVVRSTMTRALATM